MVEPYLSQITLFGFDWAPRGWAHCDGQLLPISNNQALFALLGGTYGGNMQTTFGLPDLRGRTPIHQDASQPMGGRQGVEQVTLTQTEMPQHNHAMLASADAGSTNEAAGKVLAVTDQTRQIYTDQGDSSDLAAFHDSALQPIGGGFPHDNMQPSLVLNFCIAIAGIFPSRN